MRTNFYATYVYNATDYYVQNAYQNIYKTIDREQRQYQRYRQ